MASNNNYEEYLEYLEHKKKVEAKINKLEAEKGKYQKLLSLVSDLNGDVYTCSPLLDKIYVSADNGVDCIDVDSQIDRINGYSNEMKKMSGLLEDVIGDINSKISEIEKEISSLRASI